jgi:hypothetical protein
VAHFKNNRRLTMAQKVLGIVYACLGVTALVLAGLAIWGRYAPTASIPAPASAKTSDRVAYSTVAPIDFGPVIGKSDGTFAISPLTEGEWVILEGSFGTTITPLGRNLGGGGRCYLVGIKGPTDRGYSLRYGWIVAGWTSERTLGFFRPGETFDQDLEKEKPILAGFDFCVNGTDVVVISR